MISRRSNTHPQRVILGETTAAIDGKALALSRVPYFRVLWLRRGQWVPLPVLMAFAGEQLERRAIDTLHRLQSELPPGFSMERKREPVFPSEVPDAETFHAYFRLTTPDTLPPPRRTGQPMLPETDWVEVPLEEADL